MIRLALLFSLSASAWGQFVPYWCSDAGSTDAYACNLPTNPVQYMTGSLYAFKANTSNTGTASVNFNSLGAKTIVIAAGGITTTLSDNAIRAGQNIVVQYDGTNMQMQSTSGIAASSGVTIGTTAITSGTTTRILYDNAGTLGEYTINGSGTTVAMGTAPSFTTSIQSPLIFLNSTNTGLSSNSSGRLMVGAGAANDTTGEVQTSSITLLRAAGTFVELTDNNTNGFFRLASQLPVSWSNSATNSATTTDISLERCAAGILCVANGVTFTSTAADYRAIGASAHYIKGTTFTASGCSNGTLVGGATGGTFVSGTTGACTVVITMGNSATAPAGWHCSASDRTTPANLYDQTSSSTTTATLSGTTVSGDVISFVCIGY